VRAHLTNHWFVKALQFLWKKDF